jgi:hypothetical protein
MMGSLCGGIAVVVAVGIGGPRRCIAKTETEAVCGWGMQFAVGWLDTLLGAEFLERLHGQNHFRIDLGIANMEIERDKAVRAHFCDADCTPFEIDLSLLAHSGLSHALPPGHWDIVQGRMALETERRSHPENLKNVEILPILMLVGESGRASTLRISII